METWFLNHVLGWSLSVLLLGLPGPFGAGTPSSYNTSPVTDGFHHSAATDKLGNMDNNATSTSYPSESLSPSQRNLLLTDTAETHAAAAAGNFDTEQTQTFTETSSRSLEAINLSTEPITSTTEASSIGSISSSSSSSSGGIGSSSTGGIGSSSTGGIGSSSDGSSTGGIGSSSDGSSTGGIGSSSTGGIGSSSTGGIGSSSTGGIGSSSDGSSTGGIGSSSTGGIGSSSTGGIGSSSTGGIGSSSDGSSTGGIGSSSTGGIGSSSTGGIGSSSTGGIGSSSDGSSTGGIGSSSTGGIGSSSGGISSSSTSGIGTSSSSDGSSTGGIGSSSSGSSSSRSSSSSNGRSSRDWNDFTNTDQMPGISHAVSWEARSRVFTEDTSLAQDSPDTTVRLGDATALVSQTADLNDNTYTTTISRAGERTLLSVTSSSSNSTSSAFTEDSNSHQPPSTWGIPPRPAETEDYTYSAASTRTTGRKTTDQHMTDSFKGTFSETGIPVGSRGTQTLTGRPNTTRHQHTSTPEEIFDSTPPLRVTEPSTDQSEVSVSSTPPFTSTAGGPANISGTDQGLGSSVGASTESFSGAQSSSTQNLEGTEGLSPQTREDRVGWGLTAVPSTVSSSTSEIDASVTDRSVPVTEVFLTTTPATVTARFQTTEEETFKATAFTSTTAATTPPLVTRPSSTSSSSIPGSPTEATVPYTARSTTASTFTLQTSAAHSTLSGSPNQTPGLSTGTPNPTSVSTLQIETSTGTHRITTAQSQHITTTYTHSTPTSPTEALHTTWKQADRGTTEMVVTTPTTEVQPTKVPPPPPPPPPPPSNPCVSNPCMNGGMCVSYKGHQFTCHCQQAWTGQTCNQDMNECEQDPCPVGSRCVNTRGSFSCECPLGFDLEDGRTCSRAKTFLGTFSVNRLPHDPSTFKSATMHEIQREIIQLLNVSLSVLRGYSRSTLSKKEEDGVHILAVNMFSISTDVTTAEVYNSIQMSLSNCSSSLAHCRMALHHQLTYHMESLCVAQRTQCDTERSTCTDSSGTAHCQCLQGYYKHNPDDLSCLDCGDGYKFENGTCVPCMFGFGGFNCGNFYKLIAVVVSPAGGALLLILVIALIVTCCKKDKNDINKIIFKSGDLQMSPYADFPKNNRISMEWGRETIEMQENGSTKNLLQMTDIYYSPALRNSDLERNGLYPFTGLPGSRHSCIYPAQWNPSFISDDSRRRDYF